jgi:hypothetical protein
MSSDVALVGALVLLGAGKMGGAMLQGWLNRACRRAASWWSTRRLQTKSPRPFPSTASALNPAVDRLEGVEVLVLAIKPQNFDDVLPDLEGSNRTARLWCRSPPDGPSPGSSAIFGEDAAVIRAMPNVPAAIGRGITAMVANPMCRPASLARPGPARSHWRGGDGRRRGPDGRGHSRVGLRSGLCVLSRRMPGRGGSPLACRRLATKTGPRHGERSRGADARPAARPRNCARW